MIRYWGRIKRVDGIISTERLSTKIRSLPGKCRRPKAYPAMEHITTCAMIVTIAEIIVLIYACPKGSRSNTSRKASRRSCDGNIITGTWMASPWVLKAVRIIQTKGVTMMTEPRISTICTIRFFLVFAFMLFLLSQS